MYLAADREQTDVSEGVETVDAQSKLSARPDGLEERFKSAVLSKRNVAHKLCSSSVWT